MKYYKFPPTLTKAIQTLWKGTKVEVDGETVHTELGYPQGSTLSPTMYSLLANKLLCDLNKLTAYNGLACHFQVKENDDYDEDGRIIHQKGTSFQFADDLCIFAQNYATLERAIKMLENWCNHRKIKINYEKSGILQIRYDRRTHAPMNSHLMKFPIVTSFKYLGILIDDSLKLDVDLEARRTKEE